MFALYIIGMVAAILVEIRNLKIVCWTCPNCKKQLLKKEIGFGKKYPQPLLTLKCHHCNYDLTQQK
jgi:transposase-like protein